MIVVCDTSPIRSLVHLDRVDLLRLFERVLVPPAVVRELEYSTSSLPPLSDACRAYVEIEAPTDATLVAQLLRGLQPGESEAIALAVERGIQNALIDDKAAREHAKRLGLKPVGTLALLVRAKANGLVPQVAPLVDDLRENLNFYVSTDLRDEILRLAGEKR